MALRKIPHPAQAGKRPCRRTQSLDPSARNLITASAEMTLGNAAAKVRRCRSSARYRALAAAALMAASFVLPSYTFAASDQTVEITQFGGQGHTINPAMVEELPAVAEHLLFLTQRGPTQQNYTGALLWSVLDRAQVVSGDRGVRARRTIVVTGRDGHVAVLALAEIDPDFEGKQVLLAYRQNDKPIGLRLVVPGDRYGGRSVSDVVRIELR
jgi:hypothetical protein